MSELPTATYAEPVSDPSLDALVSEENPRLQAALEYTRLGLRVIPLHDRRKEPRLKKWTKKATTDASLVRDWFERWSGSNLGIVSGKGLVVLDVDPKNGGTESLAQLIATHGPMPLTPEARTGSGGTHYFFSVDQGIAVANRAGFQPGLDIRGDGGYVVAPPSVHPSTGAEYEWVTHPDQGIAPIPNWLLSMIAPQAKTAGGLPASKASKQKSKKKRQEPTGGHHGSLKPVSQPRGKKGSGIRNKAPERQSRSFAAKGAKEADQDALLAEVIQRFPAPGVGQRHNQMNRAVESLVGRGIDDNTIVEVMLAWYVHFDAQGKVGSDRETMENELINCLRSTRNNPDFQPSHSEAFYETAYANQVLPERVLSAIGATLEDLNNTRYGDGQPPISGSTPENQDQASDQDQATRQIQIVLG
ncbi:MAG: bifunctional DNA primase/polymerase [Isosphaeraceae bacterium]